MPEEYRLFAAGAEMGESLLRSLLCTVSVALFAAGCTIHPLPDDVLGGVTTAQIVKRIRCETRQTAIEALMSYLQSLAEDRPNDPGDPTAKALVKRYTEDPSAIHEFSPEMFKGADNELRRNVLKVFYAIGIAYNFDLTMTEENNLSAGAANLQQGSANALLKLGVGGSFTRKRSNDRSFTVTDTFEDLLTRFSATRHKNGHFDCDNFLVEENHVYPIAGRIGIDRMVYDYLDLTIFGMLSGPKDKPAAPPTLADHLTFITTLDASATPKVTFTPTGTAFQLVDAGITGEISRTDQHEVTVGLALPPTATVYLNSVRSYLFAPVPSAVAVKRAANPAKKPTETALFLGTRVTGGGSPAETLAVYAVDQLKSKQVTFQPAL
ncbi:hypothetical protein [Bradyrhizobium sp. 25ACV]